MASLVVLECHVWLNFTEIKDTDKAAFFDSPVFTTSLFSPAVDSFAKCFTAAQKSLHAMHHFLSKRSSLTPTQQPMKPVPATTQPKPVPEPDFGDNVFIANTRPIHVHRPMQLTFQRIISKSAGPATHAALAVLAETQFQPMLGTQVAFASRWTMAAS